MSKDIKIGLIGLDSSHCVEYATLLHQAAHSHHVPGGRIVAAFPGGSPDWELSASRVDGFTQRIGEEFGIPLEDSIEAVVDRSDALMILSVDGRVHRDQFEIVARSGKPTYIDKPLAVSVADSRRIEAIAVEHGTPFFSASVWRYSRGLQEALATLDEPCRQISLQGPWPLHEGRHGWFFYGIHQVEMVYAAMGTGCRRVACARDGASEILTGFWPDGRMASVGACHDKERPFAGHLLGAKREALLTVLDDKYDRYGAFLRSALEFFKGGTAPVPTMETIETIAFLEAAAISAENGGILIDLPTD